MISIKKHYSILLFIFMTISCVSPYGKDSLNVKVQNQYQELQKDPDNLQKQIQLAYVFSQGREWKRSGEIYDKVLLKDPKNSAAAIERCFVYTQAHLKDKAYKACDYVTQLFPEKAEAYDNYGLSAFRFRDYIKALGLYQKSLEKDPNSFVVINHIGLTMIALNELNLADEFLTARLSDSKMPAYQKALLHHSLSLIAKKQKKYSKAFEHIYQTYKLSGNSLYLGSVVKSYMLAHQILFFVLFGVLILALSQYLGKRFNQFLKNED